MRVDRRPPAPSDNSSRLVGLAIVTVAVLGLMAGGFWSLVSGEGLLNRTETQETVAEAPAPGPEAAPAEPAPAEAPAPAPAPDVAPPPAPPKNELRVNDWLLSPYAIVQENGKLIVTGTLENRSDVTRSTLMRVFVYVDGNWVATGTGEIRDVPPGESVEVSLPSGSDWTAGNKVLLVSPSDLA